MLNEISDIRELVRDTNKMYGGNVSATVGGYKQTFTIISLRCTTIQNSSITQQLGNSKIFNSIEYLPLKTAWLLEKCAHN